MVDIFKLPSLSQENLKTKYKFSELNLNIFSLEDRIFAY